MTELKIGEKYNWKNQSERLVYIVRRRYAGDPRIWHQFEKVDDPGVVWCEILDCDLQHIEPTAP